jgi:hypothetical protein
VTRFIIAWLVLFCATACTGFKTPAYSTLTAMVGATDLARQQLPAQCEKAQTGAVTKATTEAEARASTSLIQKRCDAGLAGIEATGQTIRAARDGISDTAAALNDPHVLTWAKGAVDAYRNLQQLLATLDVKLPTMPGGT